MNLTANTRRYCVLTMFMLAICSPLQLQKGGSSEPNEPPLDPPLVYMMLWTSLSFGVLGVVLWWRGFDRYFSGLCLVISALGCKFPYVMTLPFFLVFWRIIVGRNIQTDSLLLIGQHHNTSLPPEIDLSKTSSHWIVTIWPQNSEDCLVTHAVDDAGGVISGKGKKLPFRKRLKWDLEDKYKLTCVGWVTRRERERHMLSVIDHEPMASGYSCQEYAVDIAFQISSSRTYTFMKSIGLLRIRTFVYYLMVTLSLLLYIAYEYLHFTVIILLPVSPYAFNPITVTNIFIASEAFRLGYTNVRQEGGLLQGFKDRLNVYVGCINDRDKVKLVILFVYTIFVHVFMENAVLTISIVMICIFIARA